MSSTGSYKCVNCGYPAKALYKSYGSNILKLTKCVKCRGLVDKYVEYDPVIVMIDLILVSREAQRHVIYNTQFKAYWKLLIILTLLETYGMWHSESLSNIVINSTCGLSFNGTDISSNQTYLDIPLKLPLPDMLYQLCDDWDHARGTYVDIFIWELDFYIHFTSIFISIAVFLCTTCFWMKFFRLFNNSNEVPLLTCIKSFSLCDTTSLLSLPTLVWRVTDTLAHTRVTHHGLLAGYCFVVYCSVFTVVYGCHPLQTSLVLILSNYAKFVTNFTSTALLRRLLNVQN